MNTMRSSGQLAARLAISGAIAFCCCDAALAQSQSTGSLWLGVGGGHSDNVRRSALVPDSGSFSALALESDVAYESNRIDLAFDADLQRRLYSVAGVEDETYGNANFAFEIDAVLDRVSWVIRDDYRQGRIDPFNVSSPENRAGINVFSTGPRVQLGVGTRSLLRFEAFRDERSVSKFPTADGESVDRTIGYVRLLSSSAEFAINLSDREIDYETRTVDFETESAYLSYSKSLASGEAYLALGTSRSTALAEASSSPYLDLRWSRDVGAQSRLEFSAAQQHIDVFDNLAFGTSIDEVFTADIYKQQAVSINYSIGGVRNSFVMGQSMSRAEYLTDSVLDYDQAITTAQFSRSVSSQVSLGIGVVKSTREFEVAAVEDESERWSVFLDKAIGSRFSLRFDYTSFADGSVSGRQVDENIVQLFLRYAVTDPDSADGSGAGRAGSVR